MDKGSTSSKQDDELIIVLNVEEGVGFNAAEAIVIHASLSGNRLESDPVKPGHTTSFDCNLVWETDRKSIKRMKTESLPVKIDCYSMRNIKDKPDDPSKEHIGYILVPVKNVPIISLSKAVQMKPRWIKVIGLSKTWRQHKPEVLMNLMITSRDYLTCDKANIAESKGSTSHDSFVIDENPIPCMLTSQNGLFIRLLQEEGLLQVGNIDTDCDVFTVQLIIKNARYLENLLFGNENADHEFCINYMLLGNPHTRVLSKKFNRSHLIQEKISINFRTTLAALAEYFDKVFFLPLEIMSGKKVLGAAELKFGRLTVIKDLKLFLEENPTQVFEFEDICTIKTLKEFSPTSNRPIVEYKMSIHYVSTKKLHQTERLESYKKSQEVDMQGGGDFQEKLPPSVTNPKRRTLSDIQEVQSDSTGSNQNKSGTKKLPNVPSKSCPTKPADIESILNSNLDGQASELPRIFSYNLQLCAIKFNKKPEKGVWQISFYHDKSDTTRVFFNKEVSEQVIGKDNSVCFDDIELKLFFTCCSGGIMELLKSSDLCTLCIKGPRKLHAKAQLDCNSLLLGCKEKLGGMIMLQDEAGNVNAMAKIFAYLEDLGINFNAQTAPEVLQQPWASQASKTVAENKMYVMDENYSYKVIEELEDWKMKEQDTFLADLKHKESQFLEHLKGVWQQKQSKYEIDLVSRSDRLSTLIQSLEAKKSLYSKENQNFQKFRDELQKTHNDQLMAIREQARRLEDDLMHELKRKDIRFEDLQRCNEQLKVENRELRQRNECLQVELRDLKANLVPREDLEAMICKMRMLEEKCDEMRQSKLFYKEQWSKATREVNKTRREKIICAKEEIFDDKCDRFCDALSEINIDKEELEELKRCLESAEDL